MPVSWKASLCRTAALLILAIASGCGDADEPAPPGPVIPPRHLFRVPSEFPTIQQAIDSAKSGDTVLVADGVYTGDGNRDIMFRGKSIILLSENGPERATIDCQADSQNQHFGLRLIMRENQAIIDGFTIKNAHYNSGAAIECQSASPIIRNCIIFRNTGPISGAGLRCKNASPRIINCTFAYNTAMAGGGLFALAGSAPILENCIIAFSGDGGSIHLGDGTSSARLSCCNLFGNAGGDWFGRIAAQADSSGNMSVDPMFCDPDGAGLFLQDDSPCRPSGNSCGVLIGALDVNCP